MRLRHRCPETAKKAGAIRLFSFFTSRSSLRRAPSRSAVWSDPASHRPTASSSQPKRREKATGPSPYHLRTALTSSGWSHPLRRRYSRYAASKFSASSSSSNISLSHSGHMRTWASMETVSSPRMLYVSGRVWTVRAVFLLQTWQYLASMEKSSLSSVVGENSLPERGRDSSP